MERHGSFPLSTLVSIWTVSAMAADPCMSPMNAGIVKTQRQIFKSIYQIIRNQWNFNCVQMFLARFLVLSIPCEVTHYLMCTFFMKRRPWFRIPDVIIFSSLDTTINIRGLIKNAFDYLEIIGRQETPHKTK